MTVREDNSEEIQLNVDQINDKVLLRQFILNQWIQEESNKKYRYFVETLRGENRIYLERPGRLNKGCDFVIYIENHVIWNNGNDKPPAHSLIFDDLLIKKQFLSCQEWQLLLMGIESIYDCYSYLNAYVHCENLPIYGESYELILNLLRWLFIEQDVTYWSGQGRGMLYNGILKI
ncbi:hypothetical protein [Limibacterium fermenti]|uniref:hypothetical protein n=1 Tax=Limibacterium fermenti TaxID=3229863 RepID=UPI000E9E7CE1|nr:hypothetical protein [Porphyromonadaceae bacterium]